MRPLNIRCSAMVLPLILAILTMVGACGGPDEARRRDRAELMTDVSADSLGLAAYLDLPGEDRNRRRERAELWRRHGDGIGDPVARVHALQAVVGLTPDDPVGWLDLAEAWRTLGDQLQVGQALDAAAAAIRNLNEDSSDLPMTRGRRNEIVACTAMRRAWYHYDRAEWHKGLSWARAAESVDAGNQLVWQIKGLLDAWVQHRSEANEIADDLARLDPSDTSVSWIMAMLDWAAGHQASALSYLINLRPDRERATECWRDMGLVAEAAGERAHARRWYLESAAALPLAGTRHISRLEHPQLGTATSVRMPVWLARDRHYLTGSLSAYTALAFARFDGATSPGERALWGGETVNAAGILLRRDEERAWALRSRGLVFVDQDKLDRGLADLEAAARLFADEGFEDGRILAALGHVWLRREDPQRAVPYLERAVTLLSTDATVWSDLGLVRVMSGDRDGAEEAFARAIEQDRDEVAAWYNRGLMRLHAGDIEAAGADLAEAARLAPDNTEVARLLQQINLMQRKPVSGD